MRVVLFCYLILLFCFLSQVRGNDYNLLRFSCGGLIISTSQVSTLPWWSSEKFRSSLQNVSLGFFNSSVQEKLPFDEILEYVSSSNSKTVTLFEVGNYRNLSIDNCSIRFAPSFVGHFESVEKMGQLLIETATFDTTDCNISLALSSSSNKFPIDNTRSSLGASSQIFSFDGESWPISIVFNPSCVVRVFLSVNQWGALSEITVWLPPLLFTIVSFLLLVALVFPNNRQSLFFRCCVTFWLFLCYVYSCTGLSIELEIWKTNAVVRFPFPSSVMFFILSCFLYAILLIFSVFTRSNNSLLFLCILRLLTLGICLSLLITLFLNGYILIGIICSFLVLLGNTALAAHYSFSIFFLYRRSGFHLFSLHDKYIWSIIWCPLSALIGPSILFCISVLKYNFDVGNERIKFRKKIISTFFFIQSSFIFFFFYNIFLIALLTYFSFFRATFSILLSLTLIISFVYLICLVHFTISFYRRLPTQKKFSFIFGADVSSLFRLPKQKSFEIFARVTHRKEDIVSPPFCFDSKIKNEKLELKESLCLEESYWPTTVGLETD